MSYPLVSLSPGDNVIFFLNRRMNSRLVLVTFSLVLFGLFACTSSAPIDNTQDSAAPVDGLEERTYVNPLFPITNGFSRLSTLTGAVKSFFTFLTGR